MTWSERVMRYKLSKAGQIDYLFDPSLWKKKTVWQCDFQNRYRLGSITQIKAVIKQ